MVKQYIEKQTHMKLNFRRGQKHHSNYLVHFKEPYTILHKNTQISWESRAFSYVELLARYNKML
jgi:hypothetical protein